MFQIVEKAQKSNGDPMKLLKEATSNYTPEQMNKLFDTARQYGVPDDVIKKINDINAE